jgi:hypothetical protein
MATAAAYRFSISWPRIFPQGTGAPNPKKICCSRTTGRGKPEKFRRSSTNEPADLYLGITRSIMCRGSFTPGTMDRTAHDGVFLTPNLGIPAGAMDMVGFVSTFPYVFYMGPALIVLLAFSLLVLAAATHSLGQVRAGK